MPHDPMMDREMPGEAPHAEMANEASETPHAEPAMPTPPAPKEAFTVKKLVGLHNQINDTIKALLGPVFDQIPPEQREVAWVAPKDAKLVAPVPMELFVPLAAIDGAVKQVGKSDKYDLALSELVDDSGVVYTSGQLKRLTGDKKLIKTLQESPPEGAPPPPTPDQSASMDRRAMQAM